ncbi:replication restart helicase PriA [Faecalimonas sp.]
MYADIIIDLIHENVDRVFQYIVPSQLEGKVKEGMEVLVPFGAGNKRKKGYIIGFSEKCNYDSSKMKEIYEISDKAVQIEGRLVLLAGWIKENYGGTMIQALKTVLPVKQKRREKISRTIRLLLNEDEARKKLEEFLHRNMKARARVLAELMDNKELPETLIIKKLNITRNVIKTLEEQRIVSVESERVYRNPIQHTQRTASIVTYTQEQQNAITQFKEDYCSGIRKTYLIHGITGSGKTEVYMEMIEEVVREGKQAIFLIPEIALTYQTVMRFYRRFGDRVSIMNSRLSEGEKYDQMIRAKNGEIDVMIGPRSALFTPFARLGLIVIDEEHEATYKSEQIPRYHARETARRRAEMEGASVVLGSATPSVDSYYKALHGEYTLLELKRRATGQELPQMYTVDLREELKKGNRSIISDRLKTLIEERLEKKEQIILFINRRGYAGFVSCRSCGYVAKCPHCDVALSSHKNDKLVCHYCGYEESMQTSCPKCKSRHIGGFKAGTQQIEEIVEKEFPTAKVLRMDMDTTKEKGGHAKILSAFANEEADILIGTQMIVKGHDFPNVTLVGILAADLSLYANDYRAGERTFQLLTQAGGRAGRAEKKGEVVIQTYSPEHYCIQTAAQQSYEAFYQAEINYRELMGYPPAEQLLAIYMTSRDEQLLERGAFFLKEYAERVNKRKEYQIIGPVSPYIEKINDVYRKLIYIKQERYDMLIDMKDFLEKYIEMNSGFQKIKIQFDFNPVNVF